MRGTRDFRPSVCPSILRRAGDPAHCAPSQQGSAGPRGRISGAAGRGGHAAAAGGAGGAAASPAARCRGAAAAPGAAVRHGRPRPGPGGTLGRCGRGTGRGERGGRLAAVGGAPREGGGSLQHPSLLLRMPCAHGRRRAENLGQEIPRAKPRSACSSTAVFSGHLRAQKCLPGGEVPAWRCAGGGSRMAVQGREWPGREVLGRRRREL